MSPEPSSQLGSEEPPTTVQDVLPVASGRQGGRGGDESDTACLQAWDVGDKRCSSSWGRGGNRHCFIWVTNVVRLHGEGGAQQALLYMGEPRLLDYHLLVTVPFMGHRHLPLTDGLCLGCC